MNEAQVKELVLQSLTHEKGGVMVYETALKCVLNDDLRKEWTKYLAQTKTHVQILTDVCETMGYDADEQTPGRDVVEHVGNALVEAMEMALDKGEPEAAELVASECLVLAEVKDHFNWELLGLVAKHEKGKIQTALQAAVDKVEPEEDEHVYHGQGWSRELWAQSLGLKAQLPPLEEERKVKTAIGEARANKERMGTL